MSDARLNVLRALVLISATTLLSCSKLSDVGYQDEPEPKAVATSIGQEFTNDSGGNLIMTVRAGADVILTGKESEKGTDDTGVPLINFKWVQSSSDATKVQLINRTANTVTFTAPQVTQDTTLHFTLTVSDAKGAADSAQATVTIKNVRDPDHFLQYLTQGDKIQVVLATATPIAGASGASTTDTLAATVTMTKLVTFKDRNGITQTRIPVGAPVTVTSGWATRLGSSNQCTTSPTDDSANKNPIVALPVPRLNMDDLLAGSIAGFPEALVLSDVMEAADISDDVVKLEVRLDIASTSSEVAVGGPRMCINSLAPAVSTGEIRDTETLLSGLRDSKESARAYYNTINPAGEVQKTTLDIWLTENGFNANVAGYNADAHAIYTNNYDLGFGRDMYMKFGACDAGVTAATPLQQRIGKCDVAAVVLNSSGVESAAKKLNTFAAVAMEYSRLRKTDTAGSRFVKFYTFAPDTRTGDFKRVLSLNFDRRGEQYMPQACVVCHGGTPGSFAPGVSGAPGIYANNGDINATFLPWDLDSFLYSDTDPGFSTKSRDAALRAQYTRSQQLMQFKKFNEGAYLTYADPATATIGRLALARELVEGWYGGAGLPNSTFNSTFVPPAWTPGVNGNPSDSATVYTDVFARNCRACHIMHAPPVDANANAVRACTSVSTVSSFQNQMQMGCYWEFAHHPALVDRLSRNQMPFARRTSDRMWVGASGGTASAGAALQAHLQSTQSLALATPGTVSPEFTATPTSVDFGGAVTLDASSSKFISNLAWTVNACTGTPANPGTCTRALPVVAANQSQARFIADDVVTYRIDLVVSGAATTTTQYFQVNDKSVGLQNSSMSFQIGGQGSLPAVIATLGNGTLAQHTMLLTPGATLSVSPSTCTVTPGCPANTAVTVTSAAAVATSSNIAVSVVDAGSNAVAQNASVAVSVLSTFTAQPLTITSPVVSANATSLTSLAVLSAARAAVGRSDVTISSLSYTGSRAPSWTFNGSVLSYQPQSGFATHDKNGAQKLGSLETYNYQLRRTDTGEVSSSTITVPVQARVSFEDMKSTWPLTTGNGSCSSNCHAPSGGLAAAPKFNTSSFTYTSFVTGVLSQNTSVPYVDTGNVESSGLLCYPQRDCGIDHDVDLSGSNTLETIRQWIQDGANNF